jgi:hypothetical protein
MQDMTQLFGVLLVIGAVAGGLVSLPSGGSVLLASVWARVVAAVLGLHFAFPRLFVGIGSAVKRHLRLAIVVVLAFAIVSTLCGHWMSGFWHVTTIDEGKTDGTEFFLDPIGPFVMGKSTSQGQAHDGYLLVFGFLAWGHWHREDKEEFDWFVCCITPASQLTVRVINRRVFFQKLILTRGRKKLAER